MLLRSIIRNDEQGSTLMNIAVTLGVIAILSAIAVPSLKSMNNPLNDASVMTTHFLKLTRARAISETKALRVSPLSTAKLKVEQGTTCGGTFTPHANLALEMPEGANLTDTTWNICFTPRGLADKNIVFSIQNAEGKLKKIEIALGGGTRTQ